MAAAEVEPADPAEGAVILGSVVVLLAGVLSVVQGVAALSGSGALAAANAVVQVFFMPAYPFGAVAIFALDVLTIYALVVLVARAHGEGA